METLIEQFERHIKFLNRTLLESEHLQNNDELYSIIAQLTEEYRINVIEAIENEEE